MTVLTDHQRGSGTVPSTSTYPTDDQGLLPARFSPQRGINPPRALAASLPRSATLLAGPLASPVPLVPSLLAHSNSPMYPRMLLPTEFILKSRRPACRALQIPPLSLDRLDF